MIKPRNILEINNKELFQKAQYEHDKIMANIADPSTDEKPREMVLKLKYIPNRDNGTVTIATEVSSKLGKLKPIQTPLLMTKITDPVTGESKEVLKQITGQADGQLDIFGRINEPEVIVYDSNLNMEEENNGK